MLNVESWDGKKIRKIAFISKKKKKTWAHPGELAIPMIKVMKLK
jgi:hypothetical protein